MRPALIVKLGSSVPDLIPRRGDFDSWFASGLGIHPPAVSVVHPPRGEALPDPTNGFDFSAVVVTGSSSMVTEEQQWSVETTRWIALVVERGTPFLGVCYGHQLLARAFGGEVDWAHKGREIGTVKVELTGEGMRDPLFAGVGPRLKVQTSHSQSVVRLPADAKHLAHNSHEPFQGFRIGHKAWGVQFHPEFDAEIVRGYLEARRSHLEAEGLDAEEHIARSHNSADGSKVLKNFAAQISNGTS